MVKVNKSDEPTGYPTRSSGELMGQIFQTLNNLIAAVPENNNSSPVSENNNPSPELEYKPVFKRNFTVLENLDSQDTSSLDGIKYLKLTSVDMKSLADYLFPQSIVSIHIESMRGENNITYEKYTQLFGKFINNLMMLPNLRKLYITFDDPWDQNVKKYEVLALPLFEKDVDIFIE